MHSSNDFINMRVLNIIIGVIGSLRLVLGL